MAWLPNVGQRSSWRRVLLVGLLASRRLFNRPASLFGQALTLPTFRITPPPPPERYTPFDNTTQAQIITDPRYPGFELTLPAR